MCRLTAYVGVPEPLATLVFGGTHSLVRQSWEPRELRSGSVNADGYGVCWFGSPAGERAPARIARAEPPWYDPDLERALAAIEAPVSVAALRNATPGLPVDRAGLLPLVRDGWAFVLNGAVPDFRARHMRALRSDLSDRRYASLEGVSDSETLFLYALDALERGADPLDALERTVERVASRLGGSERALLTMVLASAEGVWALNSGVGEGPRNSLYLSDDFRPGGAVLASEPLDENAGWRPVLGGQAAVLERGRAEIVGVNGR